MRPMSIEKLPSGKYRGTVRHDGKKASTQAFATRAEAAMAEAQLKMKMGGTPDASEVTMGELLLTHLAENGYSPTTHADVLRVITKLPDAFKSRAVADVTPHILYGLYKQLAEEGWTVYSIRRVHETVGSAYRKRAIPFRWAATNPARDVQPPALPPTEIHPPTVDEVRTILQGADGAFGAYLKLSANSGARRGEMLALQWQDMDLDLGRVVIRRSIVNTPATGMTVRETKTGKKGHRVIGVGPGIVGELRAHRDEQKAAADSNGLPAPVWVFSHDGGITPWRPDYITLKFNRLRKTLGLDHVRLHDLRHFVATKMLGDGVPLATVSKRLGHARASTTLDRYSHWMPQQDQDAADSLDALLS